MSVENDLNSIEPNFSSATLVRARGFPLDAAHADWVPFESLENQLSIAV